MREERYSIVYRGEILPDHTSDAVKAAFAQKFKIAGGTLETLFSGKPVVLKKDLDRDAAEKYFRALAGIGAKCTVRRHAEEPAAKPPAEMVPRPAPAPVRPVEPPPAEAATVICPKCGHRQTGGAECVRCGIVFGKVVAPGAPIQQVTDPRLSAKIVTRAKELAVAGDYPQAIETLDRHCAQNPADWRALTALAEIILDNPQKPDDRLSRAEDLLRRARELGGSQDADVLRQSARVLRLWGTGDEGKDFADQARAAYRARVEKLTDEKQKLAIVKEIDELTTKYKLPTPLLVFDANGALVLQADNPDDILAGLRDGSVPGDALIERNMNGIRVPLARATAHLNTAIAFLVQPAHMVGIIFMWIVGLVGAAWFSPVALDWMLGYFVSGTEWYFATFKDAFAYLVLFFLPYYKALLAWCVIVAAVPLAFGFAVGGVPGYMLGYVLGFLISPFMPKPKRRRTGPSATAAARAIDVQ